MTQKQVKKLKPYEDFVIFAGAPYRFIGVPKGLLSDSHLLIEDEPGHEDMVLIVSCRKPTAFDKARAVLFYS